MQRFSLNDILFPDDCPRRANRASLAEIQTCRVQLHTMRLANEESRDSVATKIPDRGSMQKSYSSQ
jgi:hypothetical protein